jgi:hypothetical protein
MSVAKLIYLLRELNKERMRRIKTNACLCPCYAARANRSLIIIILHPQGLSILNCRSHLIQKLKIGGTQGATGRFLRWSIMVRSREKFINKRESSLRIVRRQAALFHPYL